MCGFWCSYGFNNISKEQLQIINHRGPDSLQIHNLGEGLFMGAVRLAIIDLNQRSDQPFYSEDGNYTIVYNGEIYNYLELRDELEKLGHVFNTSSDTEVLLYSYVEWGRYCLDKFNGMFATFTEWDRNWRSF